MRILIGNQADESLRPSGGAAESLQRILWFAEDGDLLVLSDIPDRRYLEHVTRLTGVDPASLRFHVPPGWGAGRPTSGEALLQSDFLRTVAEDAGVGAGTGAGASRVEEIRALWPSPWIAHFATALGLDDRLPGAGFLAQGGGELVNAKSAFRALAAGSGVAAAPGAVCRTSAEAVHALSGLLAQYGAAVVKQAYAGSGTGNEVVLLDPGPATGQAGARHLYRVEPSLAVGATTTAIAATAAAAYVADRWEWASVGDRFPVAVEGFIPEATSVFAEYLIEDDGVTPTECGLLSYVANSLDHQTLPLSGLDVAPETLRSLVADGRRLAETCHSMGYRGYVSNDAIVTRDGSVLFTEINAQVSGSVHLYHPISQWIVDAAATSPRLVSEHETGDDWTLSGPGDFLDRVAKLGHLYAAGSRVGVVLTYPVSTELGREKLMFAVVHDSEAMRVAILEELMHEFTRP